MIVQYGVMDIGVTFVDIPFGNAIPNEAFILENLISPLACFR
jgi:hypothetical protein